MSNPKNIDDDETMAAVVRAVVDDGATLKQALVEQGPMLLREAVRLALHAKGGFVRAEMLKWLLPQVKQDECQVLRAGGLTLNIYGCRAPSASETSAGDTPVLDHEARSPMSLSVGEGGGG